MAWLEFGAPTHPLPLVGGALGFYAGGAGSVLTTGLSGSTAPDAAGEYLSMVYRADEAMTISHVIFTPNAATGSPTALVSIYSIDTATMLLNAIWATDTEATTGTLVAGTQVVLALTASASIAAGDLFAVRIAYASGTSFTLRSTSANLFNSQSLPYVVNNVGTPAIFTFGPSAAGFVAVASGTGVADVYPVKGTISAVSGVASTGSSSTGFRAGMRFAPRHKSRLCAINTVLTVNILFNGTISLYNDAGTIIDSVALVKGVGSAPSYIDLPDWELDASTYYRLVLVPGTANNINILSLVHSSEAALAHALGGVTTAEAHLTTYTTAGGWVDTKTHWPANMFPLIDAVDVSAGGGAKPYGIQPIPYGV